MDRFMLNREGLSAITEKVRQAKVLLVGDLCLDLYFYADMKLSELSRETPHYPLPIVREVWSPGGGGNVMNNIHALSVAELKTVSVIGRDWRGFLLMKYLKEHGIDTSNIIESDDFITNTYCKPMRMGISDVVYEDPRLDFENRRPLSEADEEKVIAELRSCAADADIIVAADQMEYGIITEKVRNVLAALAKEKKVIVDSRSRVLSFIGRGMIVKPNEVEAMTALGYDVASDTLMLDDYIEVGRKLQEKNGQAAIVTLGSHGALWCENGTVTFVPTKKAEPPIDVCGAGDTFISAFSAAYSGGATGCEAIAFANLASGVTVKKINTTGTATTDEIRQKYEEYYG